MKSSTRPLSPHLQVYRWQITMFLSILHRATGAGLALGALVLTAWLGAILCGEESFARLHACLSSLPGKLVMAGFLFAYVFHTFNGIRHLVWDAGCGFEKKTAARSGWFTLAASVFVTGLLWCWIGGNL